MMGQRVVFISKCMVLTKTVGTTEFACQHVEGEEGCAKLRHENLLKPREQTMGTMKKIPY